MNKDCHCCRDISVEKMYLGTIRRCDIITINAKFIGVLHCMRMC